MNHVSHTTAGPQRFSHPVGSVPPDDIPPAVRLAFAPVHKRALGVATGVVAGLGLFMMTLIEVLRGASSWSPLRLLSEYFAGYSVSVSGAFVGLFWGFATAFVMGWFLAFCRNLVMAASVFWVRTRAQLHATRDFLDHI